MTLHLLLGQKLDTPRKLRFPGRFLDDITALVGSVGLEVITRVHTVRGVGPPWCVGGAGVLREDMEPARWGANLPGASWLQDHKSHSLDGSVHSTSVS